MASTRDPVRLTAPSAGPGLRPQARQVGLLRLLLLSIALGIVVFAFEGRKSELIEPVNVTLRWLLVVVTGISAFLLLGVGLARRTWQLAFHLVFDLLWIGLLIYYTGGVASPGLVLLFAVVLIGNLVLPGVARFVMPALASLVMAGNAACYLAGWHPFSVGFIDSVPGLVDTNRILGYLTIQVAALFLVDMLGQLLALRLHEQRIFTGELLDQLGEGVLAVDLQGTVVYANAEAVNLLGLPSGVQGKQVASILGDKPDILRLMEAQGRSAERSQGVDQRHLVLRATDLVGRRGKRLGRTLLVADETRLRILEDNARRAEHLASLGEMAAGIAHEVRNPLTSLRGCAQELSDICLKLGQADAAALASIMVGESDRLARIVGDFLALSRLRPPVRRPTEIPPVLTELNELSQRRSDLPHGLALRISATADCPVAFADPDQLRQVLSNLISNSFDAVLQSPVPSVRCSAGRAPEDNPLSQPAVEIVVTDNGCGIPAELQERVFTPFFSTKSQGTGLGLSLVSRIVKEHDGVLKLDSGADRGTTITIYLPTVG